jgi:putative phosphoribosyl transferase
MLFVDRYEAGRRLAVALEPFRNDHPIILALPRGGVPVGYAVAQALGAPLDVLTARKLGAPGAPELAIGAIASGATLLNSELIARLGVSQDYLARVLEQEAATVARQEAQFRGARPFPDLAGRTVIVVDDGLATGATAEAAIESVRRRNPGRIIFAAPVCAPASDQSLRGRVDVVICLEVPPDFRSVGEWYEDFSPTSDAEVMRCLPRSPHDELTSPGALPTGAPAERHGGGSPKGTDEPRDVIGSRGRGSQKGVHHRRPQHHQPFLSARSPFVDRTDPQ